MFAEEEVVHRLFRYGKMAKTYQRTFVRLGNGQEAFLFHHRSDVIAPAPSDARVEILGHFFSAKREATPNRFGVARTRLGIQDR